MKNRNFKIMRMSQKKYGWQYLALIIILVLGSTFYENSFKDLSAHQVPTTTSGKTGVDVSNFNGKNFEIFPDLVHVPVSYIRASDGDTVTLSLNNIEFKARYLMINTPEMGDSPQPFSKKAKARNNELLQKANQVTISFDRGNHSDLYGRALVYMWADGQDIGEVLLSEGLASLDYVYPPNNSFEAKYRQVQNKAKQAEIGIWE